MMARAAPARLALLRLAELEYLMPIRNGSDTTSPAELLSFEARLPDWYRATLDPLPPEIARIRLKGLRKLAMDDPELEAWLQTPMPSTKQGSGPGQGAGRSQPINGTPF